MSIFDGEASLKRIAWAYGCAKRGSEEESRLHALLLEKFAALTSPARSPETEMSPEDIADYNDTADFAESLGFNGPALSPPPSTTREPSPPPRSPETGEDATCAECGHSWIKHYVTERGTECVRIGCTCQGWRPK
jgi:hypothetical protein